MSTGRPLDRELAASGYSAAGFAERYHASRPRPPAVLVDLLLPLAGVAHARLVVDLGSGTGLSTRLWAEHAGEVVGVEPQQAIREFAQAVTDASNIRFADGSSYAIPVEDDAADIVTASQSLHWMDPERPLPEIGRILRRGGVFCAYEYTRLQTPLWTPEAVWADVREATRRLRAERGIEESRYEVSAELVRESGVFVDARELPLHSVEHGDGACSHSHSARGAS